MYTVLITYTSVIRYCCLFCNRSIRLLQNRSTLIPVASCISQVEWIKGIFCRDSVPRPCVDRASHTNFDFPLKALSAVKVRCWVKGKFLGQCESAVNIPFTHSTIHSHTNTWYVHVYVCVCGRK